jgi:hypothetical protein
VHRRLAAAKIVVVHGRQVVVDERIAVDAFERCGDAQGGVVLGVEQGGAFQDQERPQPLAAVEHAVAHRRQQRFGTGDLARLYAVVEQSPKQLFHRPGAQFQGGLKGLCVVEIHGCDGLRQSRPRSSRLARHCCVSARAPLCQPD